MENIINNQSEYEYPRRDYYYKILEDSRNIFIGFGKWLYEKGIEKQGTINDYETYLIEKDLEEKIDIINEFKDRLSYGGYKVILYNGQVPILEDDTRLINLILQDIDENTIVELNGDILTIHIKNEIIELTGYEEMNDLEIFVRNYLNECGECLVIKDDEMQVEMREDNFHDIVREGFYDKCKDIINIEDFLGYNEESSIYKMNWDAVIVTYKDGSVELWQRP